jgi:hypothetical protein
MNQEFPEIVHGDVTSIEQGWRRVFAVIPRQTISGNRVWLKWVYRQKVWVYSGFAEEPEYRYAELFDLMR